MKTVLSEKQKELLNAPLDRKKVKIRQQGGRDLSYIESWHAISEMNRIFGFEGWDRETIYCKEVSRVECKIGKEPYRKDGYKIGYEAKVRITIYGSEPLRTTLREGTGHGCGTMSDLFDCIESAAKEAESDAMKRALMTFGNQFGLALYDKLQRNVEDIVETKTPKAEPTPEQKLLLANNAADKYLTELKGTPTTSIEALDKKYKTTLESINARYPELAKKINDAVSLKRKESEDLLKKFEES